MIKAEVVRLGDREPRDNPRFVVTNLRQTPRFLYERIYCARGDIENRIKELLDGLQIDRTSCCRFWANQLRVLLTAAAYVLMQELRLRAARTACARAQVTWLRDRLLKLGRTSSARSAAWSCTCRPPHRTSTPGGTSRWHSAPAPDRPQTAPVSRAYTQPNGEPSPPMAKPSLDGPIPRPSAPAISVHPASARRQRRPAGRVRDDHTVRGPSWSLQE